MIGNGTYEIIRSLSISQDLEKTMCTSQPITVAYNMTSLQGFTQRKPEIETPAKSLLVHVMDD